MILRKLPTVAQRTETINDNVNVNRTSVWKTMVTSPGGMEGYAEARAASARIKDHFGTGTEGDRTAGDAWPFLIKGTLVSDRRKLRRRTARFEPNASHSDPISSARAIHHGPDGEG